MESKVGIVVEFGEVVSDEHRAWAKANESAMVRA